MGWRARLLAFAQRGRPRAAAAAVAIGCAWQAPIAAAQPDPAPAPVLPARDQARTLANRGFELFQEGRLEEALPFFLEAERIFHAPTLVLHVARIRAELGQLVLAEADYRRVAEEALPVDAPVEFQDAQREARTALAALSRRLGHLELRLVGLGAAQQAEVTLDGVAVDRRSLASPVAVVPGRHRVVVRQPGAADVARAIEVGPGETVQVSLALDAPAPIDGSPIATREPDDAADGTSELLAGGIVAVSIAVVGTAMGVAAGLVALDRQAELEEVCPTRSCRPEDEALADDARTSSTLSTVGFVVAGVGAALGIALLAVAGTSERPAEAARRVELRVGPTGLSVVGSF